MEKIDKVIAGLKHCRDKNCGCEGCPYFEDTDCESNLFRENLELLYKMDALEIQLEVYRMNLGDAREELNRVETERDDLRRELVAGVLRSMPNDWGEYPPEFPREGM